MFQHRLFVSILILLVFDLTTKYLFFDMGILSNLFTAKFNTGIAFGLPIDQLAIQWISLTVLIIVSSMTYKSKIHPAIWGLIIAGLLGNLLDRLFLGWVRDFIWLGLGGIFNIADMYILLAIAYSLLLREPKQELGFRNHRLTVS